MIHFGSYKRHDGKICKSMQVMTKKMNYVAREKDQLKKEKLNHIFSNIRNMIREKNMDSS